MCGLAGYCQFGGISAAEANDILGAQTRSLTHRGPDDFGHWIDPVCGIALGHRRLSILDLSPAGHQPMTSASGRYVIALNGEIYNHQMIRGLLERDAGAPEWRGHSDTETLLAAVDRWGIDVALRQSVGMFALVIWDRTTRTLTLARDRLGEKPLYYGWQGGTFLFGSELKSLRVHPAFRAQIDRAALAGYVRHGYIRAPSSIFQGIFKLQPGTYLQLRPPQSAGELPRPVAYWSLLDAIERGHRDPFRGDDREAADALERLLADAVALQSVADVSVGAFLSGGIDSSLVAALMQTGSSRKVKTFTIGFDQPRLDEAPYARAVAQHLGTEHTELYVNETDAMRVIPRLPRLFDEPFGDSSAIPMYLVSELARSKVTVALSGDGGDELFGGYSRYQRTAQIWSVLRRTPWPVRRLMALGAHSVESLWRAGPSATTLHRIVQFLGARDARECYAVQFWWHYGSPTGVLGIAKEYPHTEPASRTGADREIFDLMMYEDSVSYLPDDILVKVDRAAMAASLETRVPLLDHRVVEFAWALPRSMRVGGGTGKWLLKRVLGRHVPPRLFERKKMGFGIPVGDWLRGPLRDWAEGLLAPQRLRCQGIFDDRVVRQRWEDYLRGRRVSSDGVWQYLMFQSWIDG